FVQVEEKPDVTYADVGGCTEQTENLREGAETPLLHPEHDIVIEMPMGVLLHYTAARHRKDAVSVSSRQQNRELFGMARTKKACLVFFDDFDRRSQ
ncbi:hypothetical protein PFISCL1PPCAC_3014, partial [Pristionchus fissidentatus]